MISNTKIASDRTMVLMAKVGEIENNLLYLEQQKYLLSIGIPGEFDCKHEINDLVNDNLAELNKILTEVRFLNRMIDMGFPISLN